MAPMGAGAIWMHSLLQFAMTAWAELPCSMVIDHLLQTFAADLVARGNIMPVRVGAQPDLRKRSLFLASDSWLMPEKVSTVFSP